MAKRPTRRRSQRATRRPTREERAVDPFDRAHLTDPRVRAVVRARVDAILAEAAITRAVG